MLARRFYEIAGCRHIGRIFRFVADMTDNIEGSMLVLVLILITLVTKNPQWGFGWIMEIKILEDLIHYPKNVRGYFREEKTRII